MDGFNGLLSRTILQIYLATENGFQFSGDFTELAQDFCGMFSVDYKERRYLR